jgi:hypothetical protein
MSNTFINFPKNIQSEINWLKSVHGTSESVHFQSVEELGTPMEIFSAEYAGEDTKSLTGDNLHIFRGLYKITMFIDRYFLSTVAKILGILWLFAISSG